MFVYMAGVQFDEDDGGPHYTSRRILGESVKPSMVGFLTKLGIVKSEQHAGYLLMGIVVVCFAITFYLYASLFGWFAPSANNYIPTEAELLL